MSKSRKKKKKQSLGIKVIFFCLKNNRFVTLRSAAYLHKYLMVSGQNYHWKLEAAFGFYSNIPNRVSRLGTIWCHLYAVKKVSQTIVTLIAANHPKSKSNHIYHLFPFQSKSNQLLFDKDLSDMKEKLTWGIWKIFQAVFGTKHKCQTMQNATFTTVSTLIYNRRTSNREAGLGSVNRPQIKAECYFFILTSASYIQWIKTMSNDEDLWSRYCTFRRRCTRKQTNPVMPVHWHSYVFDKHMETSRERQRKGRKNGQSQHICKFYQCE